MNNPKNTVQAAQLPVSKLRPFEGHPFQVKDDAEDHHTQHAAQKAADIFADICPDADVNLIRGGQPVYYYLISAE